MPEALQAKVQKHGGGLPFIRTAGDAGSVRVTVAQPFKPIVGRQAVISAIAPKDVWRDGYIRTTDILVASLAAVAVLPVCLLIAALVRISSPGSVIFRQQRVGKDGRLFTLLKFRTMVDGAEKKSGPVWACRNDPRVTCLGQFLRATRLDEFPQLINVIKGDMSLVGPRPERPFFVERYPVLQGSRLTVRPGLTGFAQIRSLYDLKPGHKVRYDKLYIRKRSAGLNLYILVRTIPVLLAKQGW
jgi:lipopolysaccharide/colanic/teichoic acid biosynthesis glycosyltransferase